MEKLWNSYVQGIEKEITREREKGSYAVYLPTDSMSRELVAKYLEEKAPTKEMEAKVAGVLVKYLLFNYNRLNVCTESSMEKTLGIPRHKIRRLLAFLEWEEIVTSLEIGATKPYVVTNLAKAIAKGYVQFSKGEMEGFMPALPWYKEPYFLGQAQFIASIHNPCSQIIDMFKQSIPSYKVLNKTYAFEMKMFEGQKPFLFIQPFQVPYFPEKEEDTKSRLGISDAGGIVGRDWLLIESFFERELLAREVLFELGVPDDISEQEFREGYRRLMEKYVKLILKTIEPFYQRVKAGGEVGKWSRSLEKEKILVHSFVGTPEGLISESGIGEDYEEIGDKTIPLQPEHFYTALGLLKTAKRIGEQAEIRKELLSQLQEMIQTIENKFSEKD